MIIFIMYAPCGFGSNWPSGPHNVPSKAAQHRPEVAQRSGLKCSRLCRPRGPVTPPCSSGWKPQGSPRLNFLPTAKWKWEVGFNLI